MSIHRPQDHPPSRLEIYSHPQSRTSTYRRVRFGDIESALSILRRCARFVVNADPPCPYLPCSHPISFCSSSLPSSLEPHEPGVDIFSVVLVPFSSSFHGGPFTFHEAVLFIGDLAMRNLSCMTKSIIWTWKHVGMTNVDIDWQTLG